jgi:hypothetical protein
MHTGFCQQTGDLHELAALFGWRGVDGDQRFSVFTARGNAEIAAKTGIGRRRREARKIQPIAFGERFEPGVKLCKADVGGNVRHKFEGQNILPYNTPRLF